MDADELLRVRDGASIRSPVAVMTGGSRGIGAATAIALARRGFDVCLTYRNKAARAKTVADAIRSLGRAACAVQCDITHAVDIERLFGVVASWSGQIDVLVLNASGGLERDLIAKDPEYPGRVNRDAQIHVLEHALPLIPDGGTVIFVTSHWAHLHGQVEQLPEYEPVASSKREGEDALRARQPELAARGIRLLVVTGDLVEGTITPRLLERAGPGVRNARRRALGGLPSTEDMGTAITEAVLNTVLPWGHTVVVGGALETLPRLEVTQL